MKKNKQIIKNGEVNSNFITIKIPLSLSSEQEKIIDSQSKLCCNFYNLLLENILLEYKEYYENIKLLKYDAIKKLQNPFNKYYIRNKVPQLKEQFPVYKTVYSDILKNTAFNLADNLASFKELKKTNQEAKLPDFLSWNDNFYNLTYLYDISKSPTSNGFHYDINTKSFIIKLGKDISGKQLILNILAKHLYLKKFNDKLKQLKIIKQDNLYYIIAVFNLPQQKLKEVSTSKIASLDLNHKNLCYITTTSGKSYEVKPNSKQFWYQKQIRNIENKIEKKEKKDNMVLCEAKKHSRSVNKLIKAKNKLNYKMREQMKHFIGNISNKLVIENDNIVIGDYVPNSVEIKNINRGIINDSVLGQFRAKLKTKCIRYSKGFEIVDEKMTTRTCSSCGYNNGKIELSIRKFTCSNCKEELIRDENSSFNIMKRSLTYQELKSKHELPLLLSEFSERGYCFTFNNHGYDIKCGEKYLRSQVDDVICENNNS